MISLRALEPGDQGLLLEWRNSPEVATYMYSNHQITPEEHEEWFKKVRDDSERYRHRIILMNGQPVGLQSISPIDSERGIASWAFYLADPRTRGQGVGAWVEYASITTAFETLSLRKLCCEVLVENSPVIAMHESFGFRREGYLRKHAIKAGIAVDAVSLALLAEEWQMVKAAVEGRLRQRGLIE